MDAHVQSADPKDNILKGITSADEAENSTVSGGSLSPSNKNGERRDLNER